MFYLIFFVLFPANGAQFSNISSTLTSTDLPIFPSFEENTTTCDKFFLAYFSSESPLKIVPNFWWCWLPYIAEDFSKCNKTLNLQDYCVNKNCIVPAGNFKVYTV